MAKIPLKAKPIGADRVARRFTLAVSGLNGETADAVEELGDASELIFAAHALRRTGRMARGIVSHAAGLTAMVDVHAQNPETGYDYVGVTRFGHSVSRIVPKRAKALAIALGGGVIFRASSRGFHPAQDWAEAALPQIEAQAQVVATRLGRRIAASI